MHALSTDIRRTVAQIASYDLDEIEDGHRLADDLGFDSIMLMDLFATLARTYPGVRAIDPSWATRRDLTFGLLELELRTLLGALPAPPAPRLRLDGTPEVTQFHDMLAEQPALPYFAPRDAVAARVLRRDGTELVTFSLYNYLATNGHPRVTAAVRAAVERYGTSVSASRLIGGEVPLHAELERAVARFVGAEDALVLVGGHATNVSVLGHVAGADDLVLHDALAHNSLVQGALLSGARRKPFPHNDAAALDRELQRVRGRFRHVVVAVEGAYSMDGDLCPLPELLDVVERHDAFLLVDEAHSVGTVGPGGRGVCAHFGVDPARVDLLMGTLSKAFNSCGGYLAGSRRLVEYLRYTLPGFVFSVGMTPQNAAAALESIRLLEERPEMVDELTAVADRLRAGVRALGLDAGRSDATPIVPVIAGDSATALAWSVALADRGVDVAPILYPAVPDELARLRFFVSRAHTDHDVAHALAALAEVAVPR
ncbi:MULTISPECIES: aminotransferase class I/II-fold pyridoxal phosphate-dependent enzyme [Cellulomonas]|uniref:aminotransferase class I/II-fold pyridoxal phosphate-dependent enzyme n=1 Tax=Cellulomonas TaxID=1707 RepID=UPI0010A8A3BF|nr:MULTISPECIES: aminotransferase class I/II-fold pyridoxal phosphate-dependent enzyme [Cellulomonas]